MSLFVTAVVLAVLLGSASAEAAAHDLFDNVVPADTADCLKKVRNALVGILKI